MFNASMFVELSTGYAYVSKFVFAELVATTGFVSVSCFALSKSLIYVYKPLVTWTILVLANFVSASFDYPHKYPYY